MIKRFKIIILITFLCIGCSKKYTNINYYIPRNYSGSVAIVFDVDSSSNHAIENGDTLSYIIHNNPCFYTLNDGIPEEGKYKVKYFYYSADTLIQLKSYGNKRQVVNRGVFSIKGHQKVVFKSIYVSDTIREMDSLYSEIKRHKDICWDE